MAQYGLDPWGNINEVKEDDPYTKALKEAKPIETLAGMAPGGDIARQIPGEISRAYGQGGVGAALGEAGRGAAASIVGAGADIARGIGGAVKYVTDPYAQALKTFFTGNDEPIGVAANATVPRPSPATARGPLSSAVNMPQGSADSQAVRAGIRGARGQYDYPVGETATPPRTIVGGAEQAPDYAKDSYQGILDRYNAMKAQEAAGLQDRTQAMAANANWASNWTANRDAQNAARVANWRASNGADMVLAGGNPAYEDQRRAIISQAIQATRGAEVAQRGLQEAQDEIVKGPQRNYIEDFAKMANVGALGKTAESRMVEAKGRAAEDVAKAGLMGAQRIGQNLSNEQQRSLLDLSAKMGAAKSTEEASKYERQILAMLGKSSDKWKAYPMPGRTWTNELGMQQKDPDTVLVINESTGQKEIVMGGPGGQQKPTAAEARDALARVGNDRTKQEAIRQRYLQLGGTLKDLE